MARQPSPRSGARRTWSALGTATLMLVAAAQRIDAAQIDITGPPGSVAFGTVVRALPNGNIVVTDPFGPVSFVGAVYLYGPDGALISTLTGSTANDRIGINGIVVLSNGNFVVCSSAWNNGTAFDAGAATWVDGNTGLDGVVSAANSLVGTAAGDFVCRDGVVALTNGNYVVRSPRWRNGGAASAGAATWGNGATGVSGAVSAANSLVGTTADDEISANGVLALSNGNYVVASRLWDNGAVATAGAVTWANGATGRMGPVTAANSLVGSTALDQVGNAGAVEVGNGNYVVRSTVWRNGATLNAGAATWANGSTGLTGVVSASNSLVGTSAGDFVSGSGVVALSNGNYVVASDVWSNGATLDVGAVTWANGSTGRAGVVSAANSLIGTMTNDRVGETVAALNNGNYVVGSPQWDNGPTMNAGAATWANGSSGFVGTVSAANSLVGTTANDAITSGGITVLTNGNYVVGSLQWDNTGVADVGALTWANGSTGLAGVVSAANSLIGTTAGDFVGSGTVALSNGNYVADTSSWDNGAIGSVGAATWAKGATGLFGVVSTANSLVGTTTSDGVGNIVALANGNYLVRSPFWDKGMMVDAGALTWADGATGLVGVVSTSNSFVGTTADDRMGLRVTAFGDSNYVISCQEFDGVAMDSGAVTLARGDAPLVGTVSPANSVLGTVASGGATQVFAYHAPSARLIVGRRASNIVSLFTLPGDLILTDGFE